MEPDSGPRGSSRAPRYRALHPADRPPRPPGSCPSSRRSPPRTQEKVRRLSPPDLSLVSRAGCARPTSLDVERVFQPPAHAKLDAGQGQAPIRLVAGRGEMVLLANALEVELYSPIHVLVELALIPNPSVHVGVVGSHEGLVDVQTALGHRDHRGVVRVGRVHVLEARVELV